MERYSESSYPELLYVMKNLFQRLQCKNGQIYPPITRQKPQGDGATETSWIPFKRVIEVLRREYAQKVPSESMVGSNLQTEVESKSSGNFSSEPTSTGSQMHDNVDVQAVGYVSKNKLDMNQNLEPLEEESEQSEKEAAPMNVKREIRNEIILSPEKAEEVLVLLDAMSLRLLQCESKAFRQLEIMIIGAQEQINDTRKLLEDLPQYMPWDALVEHIVEVGDLVESVFQTLESLTCKLLECHTKELCRTMVDLQISLKKVVENSGTSKTCERKLASQESAFGLEFAAVAICFVLFGFVIYLLVHPAIGEAVAEFYLNATKF